MFPEVGIKWSIINRLQNPLNLWSLRSSLCGSVFEHQRLWIMCSTLALFFSRQHDFLDNLFLSLSQFFLFSACRSCSPYTVIPVSSHTGGPEQEQAVYPNCYPPVQHTWLYRRVLRLVAQISSTSDPCCVPTPPHSLCYFHLLNPDPLSSFHRNCNKLTLKIFQHPPPHPPGP